MNDGLKYFGFFLRGRTVWGGDGGIAVLVERVSGVVSGEMIGVGGSEVGGGGERGEDDCPTTTGDDRDEVLLVRLE